MKEKFHHIGFNNLYNSTAFGRASFLHEKKLLVHGVTRKGMRGIPSCVQQQEVKNCTLFDSICGTVKVAKLEGDPECPCLTASSVYDTKPMHYLSMITEKVEWIKKEKDVYNIETQQTEKMEFLCLNQINTYNYGMGDVNIADQLRVFYHLDHWMQNKKWWWSIMFWSLGVTLTNSYVIYTTMCDKDGAKKKDRYTHSEFLEEVALYWMNPEVSNHENSSVYTTTSTAIRAMGSPTGSTISAITADSSFSSTSTGGRKRKFNDTSLGPRGHYQICLFDHTKHLPVQCKLVTNNATGQPVRSQTKCDFHNYLKGQSRYKIMMYCPACNANLCINCYFMKNQTLY